jgi:hypothetical protein
LASFRTTARIGVKFKNSSRNCSDLGEQQQELFRFSGAAAGIGNFKNSSRNCSGSVEQQQELVTFRTVAGIVQV